MRLKWVVVGQSAYPVCPHCGAYPLVFYGYVEHLGHLLLCNRCGIAVRRKTPLTQLQKKAVKRFWGVKNDN